MVGKKIESVSPKEDAENTNYHWIANMPVKPHAQLVFVGSNGASVPFPTVMKSRFVETVRMSPERIRTSSNGRQNNSPWQREPVLPVK